MPLQAAHDLRNSLTIGFGNVDLARKHPACPAQIKEWLDRAHDAGRDCFKLVNIIMGIVQAPEAAMVGPHEFELSTIALRVEREFAAHLEKIGIHLNLDITPIPLQVGGDGFAVFRAIQNLVMNARDAIVRSGRAEDGTGRIAIATGKDASHAIVTISDNGTGFSGALPAAEGEDESPRKSSEHGLGLRVVRRSMDLLGGKVDCVSFLGKGTRFTLSLPLLAVHTAAEAIAQIV